MSSTQPVLAPPSPPTLIPRLRRRSHRVTVLILGIIALSLADLIVTLTHLKTIGMVESNPIAAWLIINTRSPWVLAAYKVLTVAICAALLFRARHHVQGEIAAWAGILILTGLAWHWFQYSEQLDDVEGIRLAQMEQYDDLWMRLD